MSFRFSPGTMDSMAGVFAPPKKYRMGSGGGSPKAPKAGGTMLGMAVASMFAKPAPSGGQSRASRQAKYAFGGGSSARMSGRAVMTAERTARRVPEAVVRITGRQHGGGHVLANFAYISRLGHGEEKAVGLETSEGDVLRDGRDMQMLAKEWHEYEMDGDARRKGATSISMILSMPTGTESDRLKEAALDFAREEFANRSWVASLHVDRDHPHVHLTIARRDHDGRRFHPNREDLFRYRQRFAEKLRGRGIEANATPARARGIDPKHEPIAAIKMREKGLVPRIDKSRVQRVERLRKQGIADPVQTVLSARQATVRAAYARSIGELSASPSAADQVVARSLERFVATMPEPEPNSARAVREADRARATTRRSPDIPKALARDGDATASIDRTPSMADRLRALQANLEGPAEGKSATSVSVNDGDPKPPGEITARLKAMLKDDDRQSADGAVSRGQEPPDPRQSIIMTDRLRTLLDEKIEVPKPQDVAQTREVLRQAEERERERREREQRERDRNIDRSGPGR